MCPEYKHIHHMYYTNTETIQNKFSSIYIIIYDILSRIICTLKNLSHLTSLQRFDIQRIVKADNQSPRCALTFNC